MRRDVRSGKGDNRTRDGRQQQAGNFQGPTRFGESDDSLKTSDRSLKALDYALWCLWVRHDGWLRVVPDFTDQVLFMKWKITSGTYAGHYVMARVELADFALGVELLLDKLYRLDQGLFRPTLDTAF